MFWSRKEGDGGTATSKARNGKYGKLSPDDMFSLKIEMLKAGEEIVFKFSDVLLKPYLVVVRNADYPSHGKKFRVLQDSKGPGGNPAGKRSKSWESNMAGEIADWIVERDGRCMEAKALR